MKFRPFLVLVSLLASALPVSPVFGQESMWCERADKALASFVELRDGCLRKSEDHDGHGRTPCVHHLFESVTRLDTLCCLKDGKFSPGSIRLAPAAFEDREWIGAKCPRIREAVIALLESSNDLLLKRAEEQKALKASRSREREERLRKEADAERVRQAALHREAKLIARSRLTPAYLRAMAAEAICTLSNQLERVKQAIRRMRKVDAASGTVSRIQRRGLAERLIDIRESLSNKVRQYRKAAGRARGKAAFCAEPKPDDVAQEFMRRHLAPIDQGASAPP